MSEMPEPIRWRVPRVIDAHVKENMKALLREIQSDSLIVALKGASEELREKIRNGKNAPAPADVIKLIKEHLAGEWPGFMSPVINGTGVILHTNLGRAPLSQKALEAVATLGGATSRLRGATIDVAEADAPAALVAASREAFGGMDVLVNNAGVFSYEPMLDSSRERFERVLAVNLTGLSARQYIRGRHGLYLRTRRGYLQSAHNCNHQL